VLRAHSTWDLALPAYGYVSNSEVHTLINGARLGAQFTVTLDCIDNITNAAEAALFLTYLTVVKHHRWIGTSAHPAIAVCLQLLRFDKRRPTFQTDPLSVLIFGTEHAAVSLAHRADPHMPVARELRRARATGIHVEWLHVPVYFNRHISIFYMFMPFFF